MATDTICWYEAQFDSKNWQSPNAQKNILGEAVIEYSKKNDLTHVRALVTTGTQYEQFVRSIGWKGGEFEDVILLGFRSSNGSWDHLNAEGKYLSHFLENSSLDDFEIALENIRAQFPNVQFYEEVLYQSER